jgi:hypothetical protein
LKIYSPLALARLRHEGSASRCYFGGSSHSSTQSTSQQTYNDNRQAINNDSHNTSNAWTSNTDLTSSDSHAVSDSGNTSAAWSSSNSNSGNTSTTSTDSHNSSTTTNVTQIGTDQGAVQMAAMQTQLLGAVSEQSFDAVKAVAGLGASVGGSATDLAALSIQNAMQSSTHMLDLSSELIDKLATGTGSAIAMQSAASQDTANQAQATMAQTSLLQKTLVIAGAVVLAVLLLKH